MTSGRGKITTELYFKHGDTAQIGVARYDGFVDFKIGERVAREWSGEPWNPKTWEYVVAGRMKTTAIDRQGAEELIVRYELQHVQESAEAAR